MLKKELIELYKAIGKEKGKGSIKFRFTLVKNETIISNEVKALMEVESGINKIMEPFFKERNDVVRAIGVFDKYAQTYTIPKDNKDKVFEFYEKIKPLETKFAKEKEEYDKQIEEYFNLLEEKVTKEFKFISIAIDNCPDSLTTENMETFMKCKIII